MRGFRNLALNYCIILILYFFCMRKFGNNCFQLILLAPIYFNCIPFHPWWWHQSIYYFLHSLICVQFQCLENTTNNLSFGCIPQIQYTHFSHNYVLINLAYMQKNPGETLSQTTEEAAIFYATLDLHSLETVFVLSSWWSWLKMYLHLE